MKKLFFLCFTFVLLAFGAYADDVKVPASVLDAFKKKFTTAQSVTWEEGKGNFTAYFIEGTVFKYCKFSSSGEWTEVGISLEEVKVPVPVKSAFTKLLPKVEIIDFFNVTNAKNQSAFMIAGEDNIKRYEVFIAPDGKVLAKQIKNLLGDEDDDDDDALIEKND